MKTSSCYLTQKGKIILSVLISLVCFLLTYFYFGFYYVEYEALFDSFYSGRLTEGMPFRSIYFLGNIGLSHIYSLLYEWMPGVEWISWILYSYLLAACTLGLWVIAKITERHFSLIGTISIQVFVYVLVFADHNIHFIFTRVSYMLTGMSLLGILFFFQKEGSITQNRRLFFFFNTMFIVGALTRSESATATFLQVVFFGIAYLPNLTRLFQLLVFPACFISLLLGAIAFDLKTSTAFYKRVEPEIEAQFCERDNTIPLAAMKTALDSVKWKAAKAILWSDPKIVTPEFMRSLIRTNQTPFMDGRQWRRVWHELSATAVHFYPLCILCFGLAIYLLIFQRPPAPQRILALLLFFVSFWALMALQTYTVKINDRSFSPLISLFIFCHLLFVLPGLQNLPVRGKQLLLGCGFLMVFLHFFWLKEEADVLAANRIKYQETARRIEKIAAGKILAVNSTSCDFLFSSNRPFRPFNFSAFKKVYITDGFNMPFLPYYRRYLEKECRCKMDEFPSFWRYLQKNRQEVVVVSAPDRIGLLKEYLRVAHKYELPLVEIKTSTIDKLQRSDTRTVHTDLHFYTLSH